MEDKQDVKPSSDLACARCSKPAKLQCPKCLELGLPKQPSAFCSQDCFKSAWSSHKQAHKPGPHTWAFVTQKGRGRSFSLPPFDWTGSLRPMLVSPYREVPAGIPRPDYAETGIPYSEMESKQQSMVPIRTAKQIEGSRRACHIARTILDKAHAAIRPGITTDDIDRVVHEATVEAGAYPSPLNYGNFPKSVCTSVNEVICHGIPDQRPLQDGDIVNVDVTAYYKGFHGDLNETFVVGTVDDESKKLIRTTLEALQKAIDAVKPGVRYREVGDIISLHVGQQGFQVVRSYCGHGICDLFHCAPNLPHYAHNKAVGVMKEGQIFTIEPMVNMGTYRDMTWPDGWTAVTADGKRSAQFEHTLLVTATGCEVLTKRLPTSPPLWWEEQ
ncbi:g9749 [Coccomyxa viridis]|uniref:Methionine aminopeptidase n=1 Tax=Coccomyxa viridis TaxID=1274662 RepID=A0ABP1G3V9_9CHLO